MKRMDVLMIHKEKKVVQVLANATIVEKKDQPAEKTDEKQEEPKKTRTSSDAPAAPKKKARK